MTNAQWFLLVGGLLLARGLTATMLQRLPVTPAIIYLAVGCWSGLRCSMSFTSIYSRNQRYWKC